MPILSISSYNDYMYVIESIGELNAAWLEVYSCTQELSIYFKASDQRGKVGSPIFDTVGTNAAIKEYLQAKGWSCNTKIPEQYNFLGKDVDFFKNGLLVEVQFSNYPFLLNNLVRSELFFKSKTLFCGHKVMAVCIITKAKKFPSSNSTLYYEQACRQVNFLSQYSVFECPIALIGIDSAVGVEIPCYWTDYKSERYSRDVSSRSLSKYVMDCRNEDSIGKVTIEKAF